MPTLLLRLAGPLQSWGTGSKFDIRGTEKEPSKSGVIGMVAAAMGLSRDSDISNLTKLRFGVRIDQPGEMLCDFHTVRGSRKKDCFVTRRYYLSDAVFLAGLEGELSQLEEMNRALEIPVYPIFLGRRSCPPSGRVSLGIRDTSLGDSLRNEPWQASEWFRNRHSDGMMLDMMIEMDTGALFHDQPITYSQSGRSFGFRKAEYLGSAVKAGGGSDSDGSSAETADTDFFSGVRRSI